MEPGIIKKLEEAVVNRIAAGEIIQRPANAVKELVENSLDAKSTSIQVTVKSGGLKLLQIIDNGTGIRKEDMEIVCHRFTTSKLVAFEDLSNIATFGFRGEALASISHVARLTIQTKTKSEQSAYKSSYEDGKLIGSLTHCAGTQGTIITIEDLFYNMPQRKQALKSPNEEFQKIADILMKYAIHNAKVGITLKKMGQIPSIRTMPNSTQQDNVKTLYGNQIAEQLMEVELEDSVYKFQMKALITKANYSAKKMIFLLFINHRLVESSGLKAAIDTAYSSLLGKGTHPFVYMSLVLDPKNVDVNIHPTKHEVHFLNETEIVDKIKEALEAKLLGSKETKKIYQQMKLPGVCMDVSNTKKTPDNVEFIRPNNMIRTDSKDQKLEKFFSISCGYKQLENDLDGNSEGSNKRVKEVKLSSVLRMRRRIENACSLKLRNTIKDMVFVGVVDRTFSLFQYGVKLYLCNTIKLCEELFYQRLLYEFQCFPELSFSPGLKIRNLLSIAFESIGWTDEDGDLEEIVERAARILIEKAPLLREYFSIRITSDGVLETIPIVLENYTPCTTFLPLYLLKLSTKVDWTSEEECFETFCRETSKFYANVARADALMKRHKWTMEHVFCPSMKKFLLPSSAMKTHFYELTNLQTLYKVFERC